MQLTYLGFEKKMIASGIFIGTFIVIKDNAEKKCSSALAMVQDPWFFH